MQIDWWQLDPQASFERLGSSPSGLEEDEAARRLDRYGPNRIVKAARVRAELILLHQFTSPLIYILLAAMAVSLALTHWEDAIVIGIVLAINAIIGFAQEFRAENAIAALMHLAAARASVMRGGQRVEVDAGELVPGDVVLIESGDMIPADLRLIQTNSLECDEALLTGESVPVAKSNEALVGTEVLSSLLYPNMAFAGTAVTTGRGLGLVVATADSTRVGRIGAEIRETKRSQTPLQHRMGQLGRWAGGATVGLSVLAFAIGILRGEAPAEMFLTAIAIAVAAIPEGLPVVVTVALAVSVRRMALRNAIVRSLPAVETLGSCTVIVTDKTGTLTENQMTVRAIAAGGHRYEVTGRGLDPSGRIEIDGEAARLEEGSPLFYTVLAGLLCNESDLTESEDNDHYISHGDPTEVALLILAEKSGLARKALRERYPQVDCFPFEPANKFAATIHRERGSGRTLTLIKGAPERVVTMCDRGLGDGELPLNEEAISASTRELAEHGFRVLAFAVSFGEVAASSAAAGSPNGCAFAGLVGMMDPPRADAAEAVADCRAAGIDVLMLTGDHAVTARVIASMVGIAERDADVVTGPEIGKMSDRALDSALRNVRIFARASPSDKLRLVGRLRERGDIVAVTGDGVNDAPALKSAHVGAAMGRSGTDVAKEASEIVLTDDRFATISAAVEEGRVAFSNIRKATVFLISSGFAELLSILGSLLIGVNLPFVPAQILWLNVVTNSVAGAGLAMEPSEDDEFLRPPRPPTEGIVTRLSVERMGVAGLVMATATIFVFLVEGGSRAGDLAYAQVAALTTMVVCQVLHVGNCRSERRSALALSPFSNRFLFFGVAASLLLHIGAMYFEPTQHLIRLQPLELATWLRIFAVSLSVLAAVELHKLLRWKVPLAEKRPA